MKLDRKILIIPTTVYNLFIGIMLFGLILGIGTGCSTKKVVVPAVTQTPTNIYHEGTFVWHDLLTDKLPEVKTFYGELFGWEFEGEDNPRAPYTLIKLNGKPIGGIVYSDLKKDVNESQWISYLSVADVDSAAQFIEQNGGTIYRQPWDLANRGRLAVVSDAQGALLVLFRASEGDPAESEPEMNEWLWNELNNKKCWADTIQCANLFEQAKAMFQEQIQDAWNNGAENWDAEMEGSIWIWLYQNVRATG